ncbi:hypothetical protein [Zestomonas thermotolerans]|uniref:hypothetical protein n=1 Tax=Zestomonas thermotolerans TaxID=157784 RepID=UPI00035D2D50
MALINCGECDRMASDQAVACPHCGAPIAKQTATVQMHPAQAMSRNVGFWLGVGIFLFPVIFVWFLLRQGHSTTSRVIGFVWLALMVVAMASGDRPSSKPAPASSSQSQPAKVVAPVEPLLEVSDLAQSQWTPR